MANSRTPRQHLVLHHISDLHFGRGLEPIEQKFNGTPAKQTYRTQDYLNLLRQINNRPNVLIVTGDIATTGAHEECENAAKFLKEVSSYIDADGRMSRKIVVVPGNHDVNWYEIRPGEQSAARFANFKANTGNFTTPFSEIRYLELTELGILIYTMNSADIGGMFIDDDAYKTLAEALAGLRSSNGGWAKEEFAELERAIDISLSRFRIDPGYVPSQNLEQFRNDVLEINSRFPDAFKIAVVHHNVTTFPVPEFKAYDLLNMGRVKQVLLESGFNLLLHGHKHTFQALEERDLLTDKALAIIGAGTLSSYGEQGFNEITIDRVKKRLLVQEYAWRSHEFKPSNRSVTMAFPERKERMLSLVKRLYDINSALVETVVGKLDQLERGKQEHVEPALEGICDVLEAWRVGFSGVDMDFVMGMKKQLKSGGWAGLFFTDVLGPQAWSHPYFSVHLAHQIRHYIKSNFCRGAQNESYWCLDFDEPLRSAITRSISNALANFAFSKVPDYQPQQFALLDRDQPNASGNRRPNFEIARILLWKEEDLIRPAGEALIRLHKVMKIPLFYLNPDDLRAEHDLEQRYGDVLNKEFHFFATRANGKLNLGDEGYWYNISEAEHKRRRIVMPPGIPALGNPLDRFQKLLEHPNILLAHDKMQDLMERRPLVMQAS